MTTEQHLDAARRAGYIANIRLCQAVSDHPMDNDQWECAENAYAWAMIAAHHGRMAQECLECDDWFTSLGPAESTEILKLQTCKLCNNEVWMGFPCYSVGVVLDREDAEYLDDASDEIDSVAELYDPSQQQLTLTVYMSRADKLADMLRYPWCIHPDNAAYLAEKIAHNITLLLDSMNFNEA